MLTCWQASPGGGAVRPLIFTNHKKLIVSKKVSDVIPPLAKCHHLASHLDKLILMEFGGVLRHAGEGKPPQDFAGNPR